MGNKNPEALNLRIKRKITSKGLRSLRIIPQLRTCIKLQTIYNSPYKIFTLSGAHFSNIATTLDQPALPPVSFTGKQDTLKP